MYYFVIAVDYWGLAGKRSPEVWHCHMHHMQITTCMIHTCMIHTDLLAAREERGCLAGPSLECVGGLQAGGDGGDGAAARRVDHKLDLVNVHVAAAVGVVARRVPAG